jgi:hypothetical protein
MAQDYIVSVPLEDLKQVLSNTVREEIKRYLNNLPETKEEPEYITRKASAQILGVSLPTLAKWTNEGLVPAYRISSRIRYKKLEVEESLLKIRSLKS